MFCVLLFCFIFLQHCNVWNNNIILQNDLTRHTKNNIAILKNNNITLLNYITKEKTKLLHMKQRFNIIQHNIVT